MWGDDTNPDSAAILVTIAPDANPVVASVHAAPPKQQVLRDRIPADGTRAPVARSAASQARVVSIPINQTSVQGGFLVTLVDAAPARHMRLQEDHVMLSSALIAKYAGDVRGHREVAVIRQPAHGGVAVIRQPAHGGVMPAHLSGQTAAPVNARAPHATETPSQAGGAKGSGVARATMETVDTLALSPTVSLHLYNLNDTVTHRRIGYRVRYVRTAADGSLVEDVMLGESAPPPR